MYALSVSAFYLPNALNFLQVTCMFFNQIALLAACFSDWQKKPCKTVEWCCIVQAWNVIH